MTATNADAAARWAGVREVLAIRLDNLGDVLMTTPALAAVRESLPGARVTLLASPSGAALAPHLDAVDDVIAWRAPWVKQPPGSGSSAAPGQDEADLIQTLAARRFDAAIVFTTCTQSALPAALTCRFAGIPLRLAHCRENPYDLLTDWVPDPDTIGDGMRHEVARQLALVATVGCRTRDERLRFALDAQARADLNAELRRAGIDPDARYVVVHPGATAASRRYPAERFGSAADRIARRSGRTIVFSGGADELPLIEQAQRAMTMPSHSLGGRLDLRQLGALIGGADLLVANNSGPVHLAAALGTPVVDLYALTNPQHTPWRVPARVLNHDVPCRHCLKSVCPQGHHDCLRRVEPGDVAAAALELLGSAADVAALTRAAASARAMSPETTS
jgi:lipopolysaccharide heptosyltransferase II